MKKWMGKIDQILIVLCAIALFGSVQAADDADSVSVYTMEGEQANLSPEDKAALLDAFSRAYEEGEINHFLSLFADDARADDKNDKSGIRQDYALLFSGSKSRKMTFENVKWHNKKGETSYAVADFQVRILSRKGAEEIYKGAVEMHVKKENNAVLISELYHAYDSATVASQE